ncbi:bifunctional metallophosphatase/5'-nucleotidase [Marinoscillum pacificum]|uniref:bifunctional metallophosphatase/5'-nucleotidase n=1 Tax=Marinoscillum pacificum TaxID=392723 RepID=UPI00215810C5|nr:bifunctional UDP-sugar hydrolase/5'-nucleotidase [Marinoscillum pacificum]
MKKLIPLLVLFVFLFSCEKDNTNPENPNSGTDTLAIYFINDQHGQLENFAKIKHIVDGERDTNQHVLLVCAGDMFSGNPVVDQYEEKGFPMIDIMNQTGFDVSVLGNHEFDYGQKFLDKRMKQAEFSWVCANIDTESSDLSQPDPFTTIEVGDLKVTFLGLVETEGSPTKTIPLTHPWKVTGISFTNYLESIKDYTDLKSEEESDVLIALTHLGTSADLDLAQRYPEFDAVIGGHSHDRVGQLVNGTPVLQAGSHLNYLGRLQLIIDKGTIISQSAELINLNTYQEVDTDLQSKITAYNTPPIYDEVIGFATNYLNRDEIGCFYTNALKEYYHTDASFQNSGGIRSEIDEGDITLHEIYNMDPFENGVLVFSMTAGEIREFLGQTGIGFHVSGLQLTVDGQSLIIRDEAGKEYQEDDVITVTINDYIPAVYEDHFPIEKAVVQDITTAESIIQYLKTIDSTIEYDECNHYFRYN